MSAMKKDKTWGLDLKLSVLLIQLRVPVNQADSVIVKKKEVQI